MTLGIEENKNTMFSHFLFSYKYHIKEVFLSLTFGLWGMITMHDIPIILTIIGTLFGTVMLPLYFGYRNYKKKEEREFEKAVINAIIDLRQLGFIEPHLPIPEQRRIAIEWLQSIKVKD